MVHPNVSEVFVSRCHYLTSQVELASLEFTYKHSLVVSDSDLELSKYSIPMMMLMFKALTRLIFKRFCFKCNHSQAEYKLDYGKIGNISDDLTCIKKVASECSNLSSFFVDI